MWLWGYKVTKGIGLLSVEFIWGYKGDIVKGDLVSRTVFGSRTGQRVLMLQSF